MIQLSFSSYSELMPCLFLDLKSVFYHVKTTRKPPPNMAVMGNSRRRPRRVVASIATRKTLMLSLVFFAVSPNKWHILREKILRKGGRAMINILSTIRRSQMMTYHSCNREKRTNLTSTPPHATMPLRSNPSASAGHLATLLR